MIDYGIITAAVIHYEKLGYKYIEVPWIVSLDSMLVTRPKGTRLFSTFAGELVASGEQSFIEMRNELKQFEMYQCVTPCFRDELVKDELHLQYFIKNELIFVVNPYCEAERLVIEMVNHALSFFSIYGKTEVVDLPIGNAYYNKDIIIDGIEVGSYGYRFIDKNFGWIYGTGCAEPRLSQALARS